MSALYHNCSRMTHAQLTAFEQGVRTMASGTTREVGSRTPTGGLRHFFAIYSADMSKVIIRAMRRDTRTAVLA